MFEECRKYGLREWAQIIVMVIILAASGYLIVYSVFMMTSSRETNLIMFSIAMFGVGCTVMWFGISHVDIQTTEEKLERITDRLDKIIQKIEKQ